MSASLGDDLLWAGLAGLTDGIERVAAASLFEVWWPVCCESCMRQEMLDCLFFPGVKANWIVNGVCLWMS